MVANETLTRGDLNNTDEAARYCRLTKRAFEYLRSQGRGAAYTKLGRRVYYVTSDLDRWIASQRVETGESPSAAMAARGADHE